MFSAIEVGGVSGGGLSTGAIVGIVIGVLAVACICVLTFYLIKTKKMWVIEHLKVICKHLFNTLLCVVNVWTIMIWP